MYVYVSALYPPLAAATYGQVLQRQDAGLADDPFDLGDETFKRCVSFNHIMEDLILHSPLRLTHLRHVCEDYHLCAFAPLVLAQFLCHLDTSHLRHLHVEQDEVWVLLERRR